MIVPFSCEIEYFFLSLALGLVTGICYDLIRALPVCRKKRWLSDSLFWCFAAAAAAYSLTVLFGGKLPWYAAVGTGMTLVVYFFALSGYVFRLFYFVTEKILAFFMIIFKFLLTPARFLGKILYVYVCKIRNKFFKLKKVNNDEKA